MPELPLSFKFFLWCCAAQAVGAIALGLWRRHQRRKKAPTVIDALRVVEWQSAWDVAARTGLSPVAAVLALAKLEDRGLVQRRIDHDVVTRDGYGMPGRHLFRLRDPSS